MNIKDLFKHDDENLRMKDEGSKQNREIKKRGRRVHHKRNLKLYSMEVTFLKI